MCLPGIGFARFARAGPDNKFRFGPFCYNKDSLYGLRRQSDVFRGGVEPDRPNKTHIVMSTVKFKGSPVNLAGEFIREGVAAPDFELVKTDLTPLRLSDLKGRCVVLNIFPSLDTGVCAASVRRFNKLAASLPDTVVVAVSKDLPFAHARFCTTEGIENVVPASDFRASGFDAAYGVAMADGPLKGLLARAVVVIDREGKVVYAQLVPEITEEPDYDGAAEAVRTH